MGNAIWSMTPNVDDPVIETDIEEAPMDADAAGTPAGPTGAAVPAQRIRPQDTFGHRIPSPRDIPAQRTLPAVAARPPADPSVDPSAAVPLVRDQARSEVLHRHARLTNAGRPVFCTPSRAEIAGVVALRQGRGTDGKVIYPTREAAEAAARELEALGSRALRSYLCGRSRSGHFHLATDTAHRPLSPAEVHARIPRQRGSLSA